MNFISNPEHCTKNKIPTTRSDQTIEEDKELSLLSLQFLKVQENFLSYLVVAVKMEF